MIRLRSSLAVLAAVVVGGFAQPAAEAGFIPPGVENLLVVSNRAGGSGSDHQEPQMFNADTGEYLFDFEPANVDTTSQILFKDGHWYMANQDSFNVMRYDMDGTNPTEIVDNTANGAPRGTGYASGLDFGPDGNLYVSYAAFGAPFRGIHRFDVRVYRYFRGSRRR